MRINFILPVLCMAQFYFAQSLAVNNRPMPSDEQLVKELSQQVQYYKGILRSSKAVRSATFEKIRFDINQVTGSRKDGNVVVAFGYENLEETRQLLQCERAVIVDVEGNQYLTTNIFLAPGGKIVVNDILSKVPYRAGIFFKKLPYFPVIKALVMYVYPDDKFSNPVPIVFENIPVVWD